MNGSMQIQYTLSLAPKQCCVVKAFDDLQLWFWLIVMSLYSEIVLVDVSIWSSIKFTGTVHAVETPDVPSSLRFLSLPGGAIRTIVSANVNTFIESTFGPASKKCDNLPACNWCVRNSYPATICGEVTSCS